jgi:hypothetical protein
MNSPGAVAGAAFLPGWGGAFRFLGLSSTPPFDTAHFIYEVFQLSWKSLISFMYDVFQLSWKFFI